MINISPGIKKPATMSSAERVYAFLKSHKIQGFCADCLENETGIDRDKISVITETLALYSNEFTRTMGVCPQQCSNLDKQITFAL
jgi:hypothetical protein